MFPTLHALLDRVIDYAGIFPPAGLPLDDAVRRYAAALQSSDAWIVGRFICPSTRLRELADLRRRLASATQPTRGDPPPRTGAWQVSALGRSGPDADAFLDGLSGDADAIRELGDSSGGSALLMVDAFETRLPPDVAVSGAAESVCRLVERTRLALAADARQIALSFELSLAGDWRASAEAVIAGVAAANRDRSGTPPRAPAGVKLRTGGVEPSAFPSAEQVAFVISRCASHGVPWKATAGLHHPVRHLNAELGCRMHGFLNLLVGAALLFDRAGSARSERPGRAASDAPPFDQREFRELLEDEDPRAIRFSDDVIEWRGHALTLNAVRAARQRFALSFGSCSIDEPLEDLAGLGLGG